MPDKQSVKLLRNSQPATTKSRAENIASVLAKTKVDLRSSYDGANGPIASLLPRQKLSRVDKGASDKLWTVAVEFPEPPEDDARLAVKSTVEKLRQTAREATTVDLLRNSSVRAEWLSNKCDRNEKPKESVTETFRRLNEDVDDNMVIIYLHGGAYM